MKITKRLARLVHSTEILALLNNKIKDDFQKYETFADQIMMSIRIQNGLHDFDQMNDLDRSSLQNYVDESILKGNIWISTAINSMQIQMKYGRLTMILTDSWQKQNIVPH